MRKIFFLIIIISVAAFSAQAAELKIGYIDFQKIVSQSEQGKQAMKTLDSIENAKNALINDKIEQIKKLEEELTKQGAVLNLETKEKKQADHERLMMEYQKMRRDRDEELKKNEAELIQKIVLDVRKLLAKISEEEGYAVILNEAGIAYIRPESDMTDRVLKLFNESSVNVKK
ncbi:MAG: OmpH family outer membrane protein [Nitrospiraceae bacterium]|nr:MAG: OmpH family outer membrane protein [Nitrospiraceae bacterium]